MKHKLLYLLVLAALILSACGGAPASGTDAPATEAAASAPSVVHIGWAGSPDSLNPGLAILTEAYTIFELVYDSMYELNLDGSFTLTLG